MSTLANILLLFNVRYYIQTIEKSILKRAKPFI